MIIILSILIAMALLTIGLNVGIKDFKKLRGIVEDEKLTETIKISKQYRNMQANIKKIK